MIRMTPFGMGKIEGTQWNRYFMLWSHNVWLMFYSLILMNNGKWEHTGFWKIIGGYRRGIRIPFAMRYNIGRSISGWRTKRGQLILIITPGIISLPKTAIRHKCVR